MAEARGPAPDNTMPCGSSRSLRALRRDTAFLVAGAWFAICFLLGGGSRADIVSLIVLRPAAVLVIGWSLYRPRPGALLTAWAPFWLLLALIVWAAVSLIPLPYSVWSALPGREVVAANDAVIGMGRIARPISMSPSLTWNALWSLTVPFATMLALANLDRDGRMLIRFVVFALAAFAALLGVMQVVGPPNGPLYFYRVTSAGNAVGLFSNRNHFAIFLASLIPLLLHLFVSWWARRGPGRPIMLAVSAAGTVAAVVVALSTGSRAGVLLSVAALAGTCGIWFFSKAGRVAVAGASRRRLIAISASLLALVFGGTAALFSSGRSSGFDRLFAEAIDQDLRAQILPRLWDMAVAYFPAGSGMGTFARVYKLAEPLDLLGPKYLNQAHADYLQLVIEGGIVGIALLVIFGFWLISVGISAARLGLSTRVPPIAPYAWLSFALLLAGSVGDYPLRTPSLMAYAVLLCFLIRDDPPTDAVTSPS